VKRNSGHLPLGGSPLVRIRPETPVKYLALVHCTVEMASSESYPSLENG
jgi:hypothetical protein